MGAQGLHTTAELKTQTVPFTLVWSRTTLGPGEQSGSMCCLQPSSDIQQPGLESSEISGLQKNEVENNWRRYLRLTSDFHTYVHMCAHAPAHMHTRAL